MKAFQVFSHDDDEFFQLLDFSNFLGILFLLEMAGRGGKERSQCVFNRLLQWEKEREGKAFERSPFNTHFGRLGNKKFVGDE